LPDLVEVSGQGRMDAPERVDIVVAPRAQDQRGPGSGRRDPENSSHKMTNLGDPIKSVGCHSSYLPLRR
jgi:hypothetical protein